MTWDDFIYAVLLLISLFCAFISIGFSPNNRKYFMSILGVIFVMFVSGTAIWHSLLITIVSSVLICFAVKRFHILVFLVSFGYLVFFRTCHLIGFAKPPSYSNAIQLILTLKLVGAAFEIKDSLERESKLKILLNAGFVAQEDVDLLKLEIKYYNVKADFINLLAYSYCFVGLLTGPYYKYRVYLDCIQFAPHKYVNRFKDFWFRIQNATIIGVTYLMASHFYYIEYAKSDEFFTRNFIYRFCFMAIMFLVFRMRMYFAWLISECVCICAGMGAYPSASAPVPGHGPTKLSEMEETGDQIEVSYEACRNLSISGCEWAPSVREGMRSWNMSVQYWLATFVYRRFPVRSCRTAVTMLISAFWHGVHPGYYLSFMTIPLSLQAESSLEHLLGITQSKQPNPAWEPKLLLERSFFIRWFYKMRVFDYCCMGFLLLEAGSTLNYWWSIWFSVHVAMAGLICWNTLASSSGHPKSAAHKS